MVVSENIREKASARNEEKKFLSDNVLILERNEEGVVLE